MGFYIPSFIQKRILRYALSKFDVLDTDALRLESLDIAWGKRSSFELRDVGLRLAKLSALLQLPEHIEVRDAKIRLLRLTIPADIRNSGIEFEAHGLCLSLYINVEALAQRASERHKGAQTPAEQTATSAAQRNEQQNPAVSGIPTTADLAQSFVDTETAAEKAELRAAVAQSQNIEGSRLNDSLDFDPDEGYGSPLSLPWFVADFLQGIKARAHAHVKDVQIDLALRLDLASLGSLHPAKREDEDIRLRLSIESLDLQPIQPHRLHSVPASQDAAPVSVTQESVEGVRSVEIRGIHAALLSDSSVLSFLSQLSGPPSPAVTHVSSFKVNSGIVSESGHKLLSRQVEAQSLQTLQDEATVKSRGGENSNQLTVATIEDDPLSRLSSIHQGYSVTRSMTDFGDSSDSDSDLAVQSSVRLHPEQQSSSLPIQPGEHLSEIRSNDSRLSTSHESWSSLKPSDQRSQTFFDPQPDTPFEEKAAGVVDQNDSNQSSPTSDIFHSMISEERRQFGDVDEDLTKSRIFSHEEAASMYQSAISQELAGSLPIQSQSNTILDEGRREATVDVETTAKSSASSTSVLPTAIPIQRSVESTKDSSKRPDQDLSRSTILTGTGSPLEAAQPNSATLLDETSTPTDVASSPSRSTKETAYIAKEFFSITSITFEYEETETLASESAGLQESAYNSHDVKQIPGGFSQSIVDLSDSVYESRMAGQSESKEARETHASASSNIGPLRIAVGDVALFCDMTLVRLFALSYQQTPGNGERGSHEDVPAMKSNLSGLNVTLKSLSCHFVSELKESILQPQTVVTQPSDAHVHEHDVLLEMVIQKVSFNRTVLPGAIRQNLSIGSFTFGYKGEPIIAFDPTLKLKQSVRDNLYSTEHEIVVDVNSGTGTATDVTIITLPIHVQLNLTRLDETFSWIGGLSGILELGNSVISNATVTESGLPPPRTLQGDRRARNVRFETTSTTRTDARSTTEPTPAKVTARIGGFAFDLIGVQSSVTIDGSAIKIARRGAAIRFAIDRLSLKGPVLPECKEDCAVSVALELLKFTYLQAPEEADLDRLLALLAPSRDRDESTDDILLDTFLRQRRQGPILRAQVRRCKVFVRRTMELDYLTMLITDLKKLAPVAKYLPEDDRPGLLILGQIERIDAQANSNHALGLITFHTKNVELAHVSLPSLLLVGVESINTHQNSTEVIGAVIVTDDELSEMEGGDADRPMVHIRFIGNEMDPTMKVNLWNVRYEYHISTIMALLGLEETASGEVIVTELLKSVTMLQGSDQPVQSSSDTEQSSKSVSTNPLKLDLAFQDCALALNPRNSDGRGLLHLANVKLLASSLDPQSERMEGSIIINKLALLIIDDATALLAPQATRFQKSSIDHSENSHLSSLKSMGYLTVCEISTASVAVTMIAAKLDEDKRIEVAIRDELIVLETCADSTQTLIAILNGLQPPMPPKTELKYRTEVVPVQDMLASLSGDDFAVLDEHMTDQNFLEYVEPGDDLHSDDLQDLEYVSRFYDPGSPPSQSAAGGARMRDTAEARTHNFNEQQSSHESLSGSSVEHQNVSAVENESLHFDDNYFATSEQKQETARQWNSKTNTYEPILQTEKLKYPFKLLVNDVHIIWNLFDGYDWQKTRDAITQAVTEVQTKAADMQARRKRRSIQDEEEDEQVIEDFLFNSIYIGVGANQNPQDLSRNINRNIDDLISETESHTATSARSMSSSPSRPGIQKSRRPRLRLQRSRYHKMTFELKGLDVEFLALPADSGETQSSINVKVRDLDIFDHIPTSTWKKFATYMHDAGERESGVDMIHLEILNVKPVPDLAASEIIFRANVLPLRLHVDQDALDFLTRFFEFKDERSNAPSSATEAPFIQRAEVNSIPVKLDFKPKRVDYAGLRSGRTTEFMNFMILDSADMVLRHVIIYGVSGFDRLGKTLNDIWMPDVKRNQLPGVLAGLAPVRPLVNVGAGVRDLVYVPMREYRKDGRVLRSLSKGALAFAKTTTTELAKLGAKLAVGTHTALQSAEDALATRPGSQGNAAERATSSDADSPPEERPVISPYADLPIGVMQGLRGAYRHLERDLLLARDAIVAMPGEVMESGSASGAARAVIRSAPTVILRPALGVTKAVGQTLMGAATTLDRGERRRIEEKYKRH